VDINRSDAPVVIVGAGPTGVMLGIELARRGVEVCILDMQLARSPESRAIGIHARTLEVFHHLGLIEQFLDLGHRLDGFTVHTRARRSLRVGFGDVDSPYPFMLTLSQAETQRILEERLESLGVRVQRGVRVLDVRHDGGGVELRTLRCGEARESAMRASWVVGCDGAHSIVRRSLGLPFDGEDYAQDWLMAEVHTDWPMARNHFHVFARSSLPLPIFPMPAGRWRVFIPEVANRSNERQAPDIAEIERLAADRGPAGMRLTDPSLLATFRCYRRSTKLMRNGRVLIAGDSAHVHSPAGGQGMNTGLHDSFNLGWKLALVAHGQAPPGVLDTYQGERAPIAADVLALTHRLVRTFTISSPAKRWLRDRLLPAAGALPGAKLRYASRVAQVSHSYRGGPLTPAAARVERRSIAPGDRLPDVAGLQLGDTEVSMFDLLRTPEHTLLVFAGRQGHAQVAREAVDRFASREALVRTIVVGGRGGTVADPELRAHRRYGALSGRLVLVRPDGYVAGTAPLDRPDAFEPYLERLGLATDRPTESDGRERSRRQLSVGIGEQRPGQIRAGTALDQRAGVGERQHQPDG
jgi:2-polyprenyl-6-methoxyphenol hydroxylase-like FAD-dependent oxidoreductase